MGGSGAVEGIHNRGLYNLPRITSNTDPYKYEYTDP
jgi:hypothetical protein